MLSTAYVISQFNSSKPADFRAWKKSSRVAAKLGSSLHPKGLLGEFLSPAEWLVESPNVPYVAIADPGPVVPVQVHLYNVYQDEKKQFLLQRAQVNQFHQAVLNSLDVTALQLVTAGDADRTLQWTIMELTRVYGTLTPTALADATTGVLEKVFVHDGSSTLAVATRNLTQAHEEAHLVSRSNNDVIGIPKQVAYLRNAVTPCGIFTNCLENYANRYATVDAQTFDLLKEWLHVFADNRPPTITSGSKGYSANAAIDNAADDEFEQRYQKRFAAEAKAAKQQQQPRADWSTKPYCWSHGPCGHLGADCDHPSEGHKKAATWANKMGGQAVPLTRYRKA